VYYYLNFSANLRDISNEHRKPFNQDIATTGEIKMCEAQAGWSITVGH